MSEKVFRLTINIIRNEKGMLVIDDLKKCIMCAFINLNKKVFIKVFLIF